MKREKSANCGRRKERQEGQLVCSLPQLTHVIQVYLENQWTCGETGFLGAKSLNLVTFLITTRTIAYLLL